MKLLIDNNLPPRLGRGLAALFADQHHVEHIKDKFGTGSLPDAEWIERLGKEGGWCVLSGDRNIAKQRPSREIFLKAGLIGFFVLPTVMKLPFNQQTARILMLWPDMVTLSKTLAQGCFEMPVKGRMRQMA